MSKINKGQSIVECNSCGSNRITLVGNLFYIMGSIFFISIFFLLWIPIFGWIAIPIVILCSLISFIIGIFSKKYRVKCSACNNGFNISKEKYKHLKKIIKGD